MGKLLQRALAEAAKLPEPDQEAIGAWVLAEIESERRWDDLFSHPSAVIERMADEALREHAEDHTSELDPDAL